MKKPRIAIFVLLLLCLLAVSALQPIVSATEHGAGVFCPNNWQPLPYPLGAGDTLNELWLSTTACECISEYLSDIYDGYVYFLWGDTDPKGPYVTSTMFYDALDDLENSNEKVSIFSKGHCCPWGSGSSNHLQLMMTLDWDPAHDADIWLHTNKCKTHFCFIWHCGTALHYPVAPPYRDQYGPYGMPLCFTHRIDMNKYGSTGPAVFAGWIFLSPQFENYIPGDDVWQWAHLAVGIFACMRYAGYSLGVALNEMSNQIWGDNFNSCPIYNNLTVFGNMNMGLLY
jgi:hypothetical protein